jgi:hypothetical protein
LKRIDDVSLAILEVIAMNRKLLVILTKVIASKLPVQRRQQLSPQLEPASTLYHQKKSLQSLS